MMFCPAQLQEEKPIAQEIDLSTMPVDDSYDGPMMEGAALDTLVVAEHCCRHMSVRGSASRPGSGCDRSAMMCTGNEEDGYTLTREFAVAMLERFKDQKLIHKRFAFQIILQVSHDQLSWQRTLAWLWLPAKQASLMMVMS
jgi:DNA-directed RNA polymerase subunit N (RpoN/RPB10)